MAETVCPFCCPQQDPHQRIMLENETCYFLQRDHHQDVLEGSGVIVPKAHRPTTFDLTENEWMDLRTLVLQARAYLGERYLLALTGFVITSTNFRAIRYPTDQG